jgi:hypothetical protein
MECLSPTSSGKMAAAVSERKDTSPRKSIAEAVRRSKSQGSRRAEWKINKWASMAGQDPEATVTNTNTTTTPTSSSSFPTSPVPSSSLSHLPTHPSQCHSSQKSQLLLRSRQFYSFGSNVTSNYPLPPTSAQGTHGVSL